MNNKFRMSSIIFGLLLHLPLWSNTLFYDFSSPPGVLGSDQTYTNQSVTITAYGFDSLGPDNPVHLFGKTDGGNESGLGLAGAPHNEIQTSNFIQFDLTNIWNQNPSVVSFVFGSVQSGEGWKIYGSNSLGVLGTFLQAGTEDFPIPVILNPIPTNYQYIGVIADQGDILVNSLTAEVPVPEPSTYLLLSSILGLVVYLKRKWLVELK